MQEFDVPENDYGTESFVEIDEIFFNEEFGKVIANVDDADYPQGFYQFSFGAEKRMGDNGHEIAITSRAVGVPPVEAARDLPHTTIVDVLDEIDGIVFDEEEMEE